MQPFPPGQNSPEPPRRKYRSRSRNLAVSIENGTPIPPHHAPEINAPLPPRKLRNTILVVGASVLLLLVLSIVSWRAFSAYQVRQAEQRRLEQEAKERQNHPLLYREIIEENARQFNLDPALISAIILCESSFNASAKSSKDALGLMQLMPETADWVAGKLDVDNYTPDMVLQPAVNIRFGAWYLQFLSNRFDGDVTKMICAYHAGQGNVAAWLQNPKYSRDGITLDTIAVESTRIYAERVLNARAIYQKHYFSPSPAAAGASAQPPV